MLSMFHMIEIRYPMKLVAGKTGLSSHVLRVWERRYGAVRPDRSQSNRRLYSGEELRRLELLARLTRAGHGIRQVATLPVEELELMAAAIPAGEVQANRPAALPAGDEWLVAAWAAVLALDHAALRSVIERAAVSLGSSGLAEHLIVPLIEKIGTGWELGELSVAEEHAASAVIREALFDHSRPFAESAGAPGIVVATPAGQIHELGAVLVSSVARRRGWNVTYLGACLPAEEIVRAVERSHALAVGLSIVYPGDDPQLPGELRRLRRLLPAGVVILVGGRAASSYQEVTREIGATTLFDLGGIRMELDSLRERPEAAPSGVTSVRGLPSSGGRGDRGREP